MDSAPDTSAVHGSVALRPNDECYHLGGNLDKFILAVKQGQYPAVAKWFDPRGSFFSTLPGAALNMSHGAGQIRQLGRLSLLQDLTRGEDSILRCSLARALTALRREVHDKESLQIFIAASLVGGTGSAMFIDVALLVREMCSSYSIPSMIVGYLALPGVYKPMLASRAQLDRSMLNCAAAWRETNRFITADRALPAMTLTDHLDPQLGDVHKSPPRLFDVCYLADSVPDSRA